jgi:hypothetical protein
MALMNGIQLRKKNQLLPPKFQPQGGTNFTGTQNVYITAAAGASIYYTLDGTTPDESSTLYSGAIVLSATTVVKAIASKSGVTSSDVATATYTKV